MMTITDDAIDNLFSRPPRQTTMLPALTRTFALTCLACDATAEVDLSHPARLCPGCLGNLDRAAEQVERRRAAQEFALRELEARFAAELAACDDDTRARYARLDTTRRERGDEASVQAGIAKARAKGDALSALLDHEAALIAGCDALGGEARRTGYHRAIDEIAYARTLGGS